MTMILVIDDDTDVLRVIIEVLRAGGYEVASACDGRRGMAAFHANRPDLVIADLLMPDMDGIETIIAMHREHPQQKIIAISGGRMGTADLLDAARKLGASDTLAKPFRASELIDHVHDCLASC